MDFVGFFERATGRSPYRYQCELAERDRPPAVVEIPTGSGKTHALLLAWLYARRTRAGTPRRLVYALPMRTLVEQTLLVTLEVRERLGISAEELPVHVLMGGEPASDWREHPEREQILIGTVDMLLSRALNRGYGESRFQWPVAFGLLNADCRWVFDEVQLMGPARATSAQLDALRVAFGAAWRCETLWASATIDRGALRTVDRPDLGDVLVLPAEDRGGLLGARLQARKLVRRADLSGVAPRELANAIAQSTLEHHQAATRTLVVLNTVERAQDCFGALRRQAGGDAGVPSIELLHSRFRPPERAEHLAAALDSELPAGGRIVVATQVIEAGVDISSALLVSETAPFSSVVQRLGRCNRYAEHEEATFVWLDVGDQSGAAALPYEEEDLLAARAALTSLIGESASPEVLARLSVPERPPLSAVLRRRDLMDLFDTGADLSGLDVDVAPYIRDADERTVSVFFRDLDEHGGPDVRLEGPGRDELVEAPVGDVRKLDAFGFDYVEGRWRRVADRDLRPGQTAMLDRRAGGYDVVLGWHRAARGPVPLVEAEGSTQEAIGSDDLSVARSWITLAEHLRDTEVEALRLAGLIANGEFPSGAVEAVRLAAALHDIGKAHPEFQAMLRGTAPDDERAALEGVVWAKSAFRGGRHVRPYFRHELASALALIAADETIVPAGEEGDLVCFLVAAHHGHVRLTIRGAPGEPTGESGAARVLGIEDGDELPGVETPLGPLAPCVLSLGPMELGDVGGGLSWTARTCVLRDRSDLGPFRLAYLEALVRIADWRASGA
jgi:CRISPR-associated endonuclease/helicase Cas3